MRTSVSTPKPAARFERFNRGKLYAKQIKPFNFLLSMHSWDDADAPKTGWRGSPTFPFGSADVPR